MARAGDNHKGGRKTKAEEMGLEKNMNTAFKKLTNGNSDVDGATAILFMMWQKAQGGDTKAIEWLAHRYYGKEPKQIIVEGDIEHSGASSLQNFIKQALNDKTEPEVE